MNNDNELNAYKLHVIKSYCEGEIGRLVQKDGKVYKTDARTYEVVDRILRFLSPLYVFTPSEAPSTPQNEAVIAPLPKGKPMPTNATWDEEDDLTDGTEF